MNGVKLDPDKVQSINFGGRGDRILIAIQLYEQLMDDLEAARIFVDQDMKGLVDSAESTLRGLSMEVKLKEAIRSTIKVNLQEAEEQNRSRNIISRFTNIRLIDTGELKEALASADRAVTDAEGKQDHAKGHYELLLSVRDYVLGFLEEQERIADQDKALERKQVFIASLQKDLELLRQTYRESGELQAQLDQLNARLERAQEQDRKNSEIHRERRRTILAATAAMPEDVPGDSLALQIEWIVQKLEEVSKAIPENYWPNISLEQRVSVLVSDRAYYLQQFEDLQGQLDVPQQQPPVQTPAQDPAPPESYPQHVSAVWLNDETPGFIKVLFAPLIGLYNWYRD